MSTSINFVTKHKDILFISQVRGDGGNTTGYSTPTEYYTTDNCIISSGVTSVVSILVCLIVVVIFYTSKEMFYFVLHYYAYFERLSKKWVSDYCLIPSGQFFSCIMTRTSHISMRWWWYPLCNITTHIVLTHWNNSPRERCFPTWGQPVFAHSSYWDNLTEEATKNSFIVYSLIRPELRHTIYHTPDEYANHYTTDAVSSVYDVLLCFL